MIPIGTADLGAGSKLLAVARDNAGKIIYGAVAIEGQMQQGIANHLFGIGYNCTPQRNFFVRNFLESSYLEFSAKLHIYMKVLEEIGDLSTNKEKEQFGSIFRKIMMYRNSMAHGKLKTVNGTVVIEYFQKDRITAVINEQYLAEIESAFVLAFNTVKLKNEKITSFTKIASEIKVPG